MPIPKPHKDENKDHFIDRCMGDDAMQEYDEDQRAAICYRQWRDRAEHAGEKPMARSFAHLVGLGKRSRAEDAEEERKDRQERDEEEARAKAAEDEDDIEEGETEEEKKDREAKAKKKAKAEDDDYEDGDDDGDKEEMRGHGTISRARARERGRIAAILAAPQAALNLPLAVELACNSTMSRDEALRILARTPVPARADRAGRNPRIGHGGGIGPGFDGSARIQSMWDTAFARVVPAMHRARLMNGVNR